MARYIQMGKPWGGLPRALRGFDESAHIIMLLAESFENLII
jgi:hypothetical protein